MWTSKMRYIGIPGNEKTDRLVQQSLEKKQEPI